MEVICLIYGIPSLLLSLFFLKFLSRAEFKYSFYRLIQCDITLNIVCYLNGWFTRFSNWSVTIPMMLVIYENVKVVLRFTPYFVNFFFNAQAMSVIFLSVHRLTTILYITANEFWNKYYLPIYLLILLLSSIPCIHAYSIDGLPPNTFNYAGGVFVPTPLDPAKRELQYKIFFVLSSIFFTIILVVNVLTIFMLVKRLKLSNNTTSQSQKLRRNLTIITIINSSIFFIVFLWNLFGDKTLGREFWVASMYILSDALSLSLPYILLAFDQNVRKTLKTVTGSNAVKFANYLGYASNSVHHRTASIISVI
ncbi:unnamed protein product [Caenorhabditis brenneri]